MAGLPKRRGPDRKRPRLAAGEPAQPVAQRVLAPLLAGHEDARKQCPSRWRRSEHKAAQCFPVRFGEEASVSRGGVRSASSASPACQLTRSWLSKPETAIVNGAANEARPANVARRCSPD